MNCIVCKVPMVVLELNQVEIDYCLECGGIWLDGGEMEILLEDPVEVKKLLTEFAAGKEKVSSQRRCPACRKRMELVTVGHNKKIQVDRCARNHGIWFDRGELDEILNIFDPDRHSKVHNLLKEIFNK